MHGASKIRVGALDIEISRWVRLRARRGDGQELAAYERGWAHVTGVLGADACPAQVPNSQDSIRSPRRAPELIKATPSAEIRRYRMPLPVTGPAVLAAHESIE